MAEHTNKMTVADVLQGYANWYHDHVSRGGWTNGSHVEHKRACEVERLESMLPAPVAAREAVAWDAEDYDRVLTELQSVLHHAAGEGIVPRFDLLGAVGAIIEQRTPQPSAGALTGAFIDAKVQWSLATFGPGERTAGVCKHIRKETVEAERDPRDVREWADIILLAMDGAVRAGATGDELIAAVIDKDAENRTRTWPDWRTVPPDAPIEHEKPSAGAVTEWNAAIEKAAQTCENRSRTLLSDKCVSEANEAGKCASAIRMYAREVQPNSHQSVPSDHAGAVTEAARLALSAFNARLTAIEEASGDPRYGITDADMLDAMTRAITAAREVPSDA